MSADIQIVSAGAVSSLGLSLSASSAAIRAGIDNFKDTDFTSNGNPILGARVSEEAFDGFSENLIYKKSSSIAKTIKGGAEKYFLWLKSVIEECIFDLVGLDTKNIQNFLIIQLDPHHDLDDLINRKSLADVVVKYCSEKIDLTKDRITLIQFAEGSSACAKALELSQNWLNKNDPNSYVLLFSADSYLSVPRIKQALQQNRILTEEKAEGFIPSEGAAAVLLASTESDVSGLGCHEKLLIKGVGNGVEPAGLMTEEVCFGLGLAKATKDALEQAKIAIEKLDFRLSNISGEEYFFDEAAMAWGRLLRQPMKINYDWQQPATKIGHLGVVSGIFYMAYIYHLHRVNRHTGKTSLIQLSSAQRERAAIVLSYE